MTIKYYAFAGQMVAMQDGAGLQYFLTDHLGSVVAVTDASGTLISQQRYLPFGGERTNIPSPNLPTTDYGYTGQRDLDPGMGGLMDYKARFYSPYLNRFIQPDTIVPNPFYSQSLDRYAYVNNSPMNYVDPSGHICTDPEDAENGVSSSKCDKADKLRSSVGKINKNTDEDDPNAGEYCEPGYGCWKDGLTDISGTSKDPAVYISAGIACLSTGLCPALGRAGLVGLENFGWRALEGCSRIPICLRLAIVAGIYYPSNYGYSTDPAPYTLTRGIITRYGDDKGFFASPVGTSISARALPFHQWKVPINGYEIIKPMEVLAGTVKPYYGLPGGGVQYQLSQTFEWYVRNGFLEKLPP